MIYFTQEAQEKLDKLFYYPYTFGKHIDKANKDLYTIENSLPILPLRIGTHSVIIRGIGTFTYLCDGRDFLIQLISWSTLLTNFYYKKSNFIVFTSSSNIASVHPALYADRIEPSFECDNGFKVVSRFVTIRGKRTEVFNFKDLSGHIICDIDFTQVKPFDEYKDMTARGYTPNRRCYMVFEDGYKEEVNESRNTRLESIINECVDRCLRKYLLNKVSLNEAKQPKETDKKFDKWKNIFDSYLMEMISELQTDYLDRLGVFVKINPNYIFNGGKGKWLASYERRSQQILNGIISIGINYSLLYSEMCRRHIDKDRFNIEAQARITIGHEIGHGLVDYIKNLRLEQDILSQMPNVTIIRRCGGRKEETLVEEFGEYQFPEATSCWGSILCEALEELNNKNQWHVCQQVYHCLIFSFHPTAIVG